MRAGWLNSLSAALKREETDFPCDLESYQALLGSREQARIEAKAETMADLKNRLSEAESASQRGLQQLTELSSVNQTLTDQVTQLQHQLNAANLENGKMLSTVEQLEKQTSTLRGLEIDLRAVLDERSRKLGELENALKTASKSVWSRLQFVLRGSVLIPTLFTVRPTGRPKTAFPRFRYSALPAAVFLFVRLSMLWVSKSKWIFGVS